MVVPKTVVFTRAFALVFLNQFLIFILFISKLHCIDSNAKWQTQNTFQLCVLQHRAVFEDESRVESQA